MKEELEKESERAEKYEEELEGEEFTEQDTKQLCALMNRWNVNSRNRGFKSFAHSKPKPREEPQSTKTREVVTGSCFNCKERVHYFRDCTKAPTQWFCFGCGTPNKFSDTCDSERCVEKRKLKN